MNVKWFGSECRRARGQARLAAAGFLEAEERRHLVEHLGRCSRCRYYSGELKILGRALHDWEASVPEPAVSQACAAQWRRAIREEPRRDAKKKAMGNGTDGMPDEREAVWFGLGRAIPVSLVLVWLVTIGIYLNTPEIHPEDRHGIAPNMNEIRMVMQWLLQFKEQV